MESDGSKTDKQEDMVYSSKDILANATRRNRSFFGRVKAERLPLKNRIRDLLSKVKSKVRKFKTPGRGVNKRRFMLSLVVIAAGIVIGVVAFLILSNVLNSDNEDAIVNIADNIGDDYDEADDEEDAQLDTPYQYSWSEKLADLEAEAYALIANGDEESLQKAWNLYEDYLSNFSDPLTEDQTEYLDALLSYAGTVLDTTGDLDKAQEILSRIDIDSYTCPNNLTYISQKAQYYGYYQSIYEELGNTELADEYAQKIGDVLAEVDYESGDGDGEQEETSNEE